MRDLHFRRLVIGICLVFCFGLQSLSAQGEQLNNEDFENPEALAALLDKVIPSDMIESGIPGLAISIVKDGKPIISKAYGVANLDSESTVSFDQTIFRIGSITKVFTGIGLMQLIDKGLVSMDDDINKYLPESLRINDHFKDPVRIWHLLSHTAGFDQILAGRVFETREERQNLEEALVDKLIRVRPSGLVTCYDTYGMMVAGLIIERVSGTSYASYVQDNIFKPLGMSDSYVEVDDAARNNLALGYRKSDDGMEAQNYEWYSSLPASSIDATTSDMEKFMIAVLKMNKGAAGEVLSEKNEKKLLKTTFTNHPGFPGYANTFWEQYFRGIRTVGHGGVMQGYQSNMVLIPSHNIGIYMVYNLENERANLREVVVNKMMERWFPNYEINPPETSDAFQVETKSLEGVYASNLYCHTCYEGEGYGRSIFPIRSEGPGKISFWGSTFYAESPTNFVSTSGKTKIVFKKNDRGEVRYLLLNSTNYVYEKLGQPLIDEVLGFKYPSDTVAPIQAMTYRGMNDLPKAIESYEGIVKLRPNDAVAYYYLGYSYRGNKQSKEAVRALERSFDLGKWRPYSAGTIADIYLNDLENQDKALEWIKTAMKEGMSKEDALRNPAYKDLRQKIKAIGGD